MELRRLALALLLPAMAALPTAGAEASVIEGKVWPRSVTFDSGRPLQIALTAMGAGHERLRVEIIKHGSGRIVKGFGRRVAFPRNGGRRSLRQIWAGRTWAGDPAPKGRYYVRVAGRVVGSFDFRTHLPPVTGKTGYRGPVGEFGAPRNGGRIHEGLDILAPCGRKLVAVRGGRVAEVGFDPVLYGHYLKIKGRSEPYSYFYSHLIATPAVARGHRIRTGAVVGEVGQTGNAATTPCHLHFEIHRRGRPLNPLPFLLLWS